MVQAENLEMRFVSWCDRYMRSRLGVRGWMDDLVDDIHFSGAAPEYNIILLANFIRLSVSALNILLFVQNKYLSIKFLRNDSIWTSSESLISKSHSIHLLKVLFKFLLYHLEGHYLCFHFWQGQFGQFLKLKAALTIINHS